MKMTWKKKSSNKRLALPNLPFDFDNQNEDNPQFILQSNSSSSNNNNNNNNNNDNKEGQLSNEVLADVFLQQGNQLAQDSKYREALGKWETAITLMPEKAVLHEQKAQVLLEIGDSWGALKAATRATELDPSWAEAWTTLGRAQLNFGEPDSAIATFDKALSIKADLAEAKEDRQTAVQLVKKRKQLHSSGLSTNSSRFMVMEAKPA